MGAVGDPTSDGQEYDLPLTPERAWENLQDALVADFIDGLPDDIRTSDLAARLHVSRSSLMTNIRRGNVVAVRRNGHWEIDARASIGFLRGSILSLRERRRRSVSEDEGVVANATVSISGPAAELLSEVMREEQLSASDAVELALRSLRGHEERRAS